ncbi:MAG: hypothetical protein KC800_16795 [Candidatus Eremiobacteraeota bacterium]|nr:hypothetical protein [Candidatus Eremiobacteraeota bacterium]
MSGIPKILHQIWLGPRPAPRKWMDSWRQHHPDWEYHLWTEENLPPLRNPAAFEKASCYPGKADVLRLEVLYLFGGVYADADSVCLKPLDPVLEEVEKPFFAALEHSDGASRIIANSVLGATPQNPDIETLLSGLKPEPNTPAWQATGPLYLTRMHERLGFDLQLLPTHYFYPWHFSDLENSPLLRRGEAVRDAYCFQYWGSTLGSYNKSEIRNRINWLLQRPGLNWLRGLLGLAPQTYQILLVEETRHHGQVLAPLLDDLNDAGVSWKLLVHPEHHDLGRFGNMPNSERVELLDESSWTRCAQLAREVLAHRPQAVWFLSPTHQGLVSYLTTRLIARKVALTLHLGRFYPSPRSFQGTLKGKFGKFVFWNILRPDAVVTLGKNWLKELPSLFGSNSSIDFRRYQPLMEAPTLPESKKVRFFLPGPLLGEYRDFHVLLEALEQLPLSLPVEIVVGGAKTRLGPSDQGLLEFLNADSRVTIDLRDWFQLEELNELAASCHFLLQAPDLDSSRIYTSSIQSFRNGLPRPLLAAWEESDLQFSSGVELAERMELAVRQVRDGSWEKQVSQMRENSAMIRMENLSFLRELSS